LQGITTSVVVLVGVDKQSVFRIETLIFRRKFIRTIIQKRSIKLEKNTWQLAYLATGPFLKSVAGTASGMFLGASLFVLGACP
jgi:hypothetical protein